MIVKKIQIELIDGQVEEFEDIEWNDSEYGISLFKYYNGDRTGIFFYPFSSILKVKAI